MANDAPGSEDPVSATLMAKPSSTVHFGCDLPRCLQSGPLCDRTSPPCLICHCVPTTC
ncbi:uncharacterized protein BO66DRAFT_388376 [Aspergillus aculeatinus CBS 121060]|uniref:Uncharacterized protein n=1 Tax=Aspergillus aculeatinus CBS 121060 TaxID=1448322 RepID=A0ACD1HLT0_9EURO|nr:hypothetical protein BO66DRAFT_388376 [Aspergillus aculeatinus CBS 121060]RAH74323.1 hypothetical protein BO66DRAFT_388376 [Aspergillus aculeatinus CBS 121060]